MKFKVRIFSDLKRSTDSLLSKRSRLHFCTRDLFGLHFRANLFRRRETESLQWFQHLARQEMFGSYFDTPPNNFEHNPVNFYNFDFKSTFGITRTFEWWALHGSARKFELFTRGWLYLSDNENSLVLQSCPQLPIEWNAGRVLSFLWIFPFV